MAKRKIMAFNPITYLKESKAEIDKVVWPTRSQTVRLTLVVILVSVIVGAYITAVDTIFAKLVEVFLK